MARGSAAVWLAVLVIACDKRAPSDDAAAAAADSQQASDAAGAEAKREAAAAYAEFSGNKTGSAEGRRKSYVSLVAALEKAKSVAGMPAYEGIPSRRAAELLAKLDTLNGEEGAASDGLAIPEVPKHEPPKFDGAFPLGGAVRQCFKDGVALESNGKFYFIRDAVCPTLALLQGYVEDTGSTVQLDIGRDGRQAAVVTISDAEKAQDDRAAHRKAVAEYEADYAQQAREYKAAVKDRGPKLEAAKRRQAARTQARDAAATDLDVVLVALASGKVGVPPPAPTSQPAINPNDLPSAIPAAAPNPGPSARKPGPAKGGDGPDARRKCIAACVDRCNGDANCERGCVTSSCK
jgi:hypothetical protein